MKPPSYLERGVEHGNHVLVTETLGNRQRGLALQARNTHTSQHSVRQGGQEGKATGEFTLKQPRASLSSGAEMSNARPVQEKHGQPPTHSDHKPGGAGSKKAAVSPLFLRIQSMNSTTLLWPPITAMCSAANPNELRAFTSTRGCCMHAICEPSWICQSERSPPQCSGECSPGGPNGKPAQKSNTATMS